MEKIEEKSVIAKCFSFKLFVDIVVVAIVVVASLCVLFSFFARFPIVAVCHTLSLSRLIVNDIVCFCLSFFRLTLFAASLFKFQFHLNFLSVCKRVRVPSFTSD